MPAASAHRLRFLIGVALGAVLGAALLRGFVSDASRQVADEAEERQAVVTLQALTSLVQRAGGEGDAVRSALAAWQSRTPAASQARVFRADGIRLEASTAPDDAGDRAAPRRLRREEKPLYDRSQRIAAAVQTNREEQHARKPEIEVAPAGARLSLAGPLEKNGAVVGIVEIETAPQPVPRRPGWSGFLLALIAPIAVFGGLAFLLGEKRLPLLAAAVVCVAASLSLMGRAAVSELAAQQQRAAEQVAERVRDQAAVTQAVAAAQGLSGAAPAPGSWDVDDFRQPLGLLTPDGSVAFTSYRKGKPDLWVGRAGGEAKVLVAQGRMATGISYSLDGRRIAYSLADGSLLVGISRPRGTSYFNSVGELLRLVDEDGDGVADGPGTILFDGLPGSMTSVRQAGSLFFVTSVQSSSEISVLRAGATPATPAGRIGWPSSGTTRPRRSAPTAAGGGRSRGTACRSRPE